LWTNRSEIWRLQNEQVYFDVEIGGSSTKVIVAFLLR